MIPAMTIREYIGMRAYRVSPPLDEVPLDVFWMHLTNFEKCHERGHTHIWMRGTEVLVWL